MLFLIARRAAAAAVTGVALSTAAVHRHTAPLCLAADPTRPGAAATTATTAATAITGTAATAATGTDATVTTVTAAAAAAAATAATTVRVVSYNVLSSSLAGADHFNASDPADLEAPTRLSRLQVQLEEQIAAGAVICLQEVSAKWAGDLVPFFERRKYTLVTGLYGNRFNGYMGCALAWPTERYASEQVDIARAADHKSWPKPSASASAPASTSAVATVRRWWYGVKSAVTRRLSPPPPPPLNVWAESARRHNVLLSARLTCRNTGKSFCVSTYHMPCLFGTTEKVQVMVIHAALAAQHASSFADGLPYILAGDFNAVPASPPYRLLTLGTLPDDDPHIPTPRAYDPWAPTVPAPLTSAYAAALGTEPSFTNFAKTSWGDEPFIATLDYIFLSDGWRVKEVKPLIDSSQIPANLKSYPSPDEPSDHVMLWAELELTPAPGL